MSAGPTKTCRPHLLCPRVPPSSRPPPAGGCRCQVLAAGIGTSASVPASVSLFGPMSFAARPHNPTALPGHEGTGGATGTKFLFPFQHQLIFGGTRRTPNPKAAKHKLQLSPERPRLLVRSPKPAGPRGGRWPEGRRRRGRCRGKLLISYGTLSSHSYEERELASRSGGGPAHGGLQPRLLVSAGVKSSLSHPSVTLGPPQKPRDAIASGGLQAQLSPSVFPLKKWG